MHGDTESAMQVVRGAVTTRPWGVTLGALGLGGRTALLTVRADDKVFRVAFDRGIVIGASSPVAADSAARVALTSHLISPAQIDEIRRQLAETPDADEVEVVAAAARLSPAQVYGLRARLLAQRAARTFCVERGTYELEDRAPGPSGHAGAGVDVRVVIYSGARLYLSELRLALELRQLGARFVLRPGAAEEIGRYGFTLAERPVLEALRRGTSLPELEANQRELDPRIAQAVIYALASCDALVSAGRLALGSEAMRPLAREEARAPTLLAVPAVPVVPVVPVVPPPVPPPRVRAGSRGKSQTILGGQLPRPPAPPSRPRARTVPPSRSKAQTVPPVRPKAQTVPPARPKAQTVPPLRARGRTVPPARAKGRTVPPLRAKPALRLKARTVPPPQAQPEAVQVRPRGVPPPIPPRQAPSPPRPPQPQPQPQPQRPPTSSRLSPPVRTPDRRLDDSGMAPLPRSMLDTFCTGQTTTVRPSALVAHEVLTMIEFRTALLDRGADHFELLGVEFGAPVEDIHAAYVELSRHLRPMRLAELGITDESFAAQRLLAQLGIAFTVLTDRILRPEYIAAVQAASRPQAAGRP